MQIITFINFNILVTNIVILYSIIISKLSIKPINSTKLYVYFKIEMLFVHNSLIQLLIENIIILSNLLNSPFLLDNLTIIMFIQYNEKGLKNNPMHCPHINNIFNNL